MAVRQSQEPEPEADAATALPEKRRDIMLIAISTVTVVEILLIVALCASRWLSGPEQVYTAHVTLGQTYESRGDLADSVAEYTAMIAAKPQDCLGYRLRASAERRLGRYTTASADDTTAINLLATPAGVSAAASDPGGPNPAKQTGIAQLQAAVYVDRGRARQASGAYADAVADYTSALAADNNSDARLARAQADILAGRPADAAADCHALIVANPKDPGAYVVRGDISARQGKGDLALADYNRALRLDPTYVPAYVARGHADVVANRYDGALQNWRDAVHAMPSNSAVWWDLASAEFGSGDYKDSIAGSRHALSLDNSLVAARYRIGDSYALLNDWHDALPAYQDALANSAPSDIAINAGQIHREYAEHASAPVFQKAEALVSQRLAQLKRYGEIH